MQIKDYIRTQVFQPRLNKAGCLVIYDPERRYRELSHDLASDAVTVVDASESSIESREAASRALRDLASRGSDARVILYVPASKPVTNEQKQSNPFAVYGECGAVFPEDDNEEYQSLCIKAKPEYASEIRQTSRSIRRRLEDAFYSFRLPGLSLYSRRSVRIVNVFFARSANTFAAALSSVCRVRPAVARPSQ